MLDEGLDKPEGTRIIPEQGVSVAKVAADEEVEPGEGDTCLKPKGKADGKPLWLSAWDLSALDLVCASLPPAPLVGLGTIAPCCFPLAPVGCGFQASRLLLLPFGACVLCAAAQYYCECFARHFVHVELHCRVRK